MQNRVVNISRKTTFFDNHRIINNHLLHTLTSPGHDDLHKISTYYSMCISAGVKYYTIIIYNHNNIEHIIIMLYYMSVVCFPLLIIGVLLRIQCVFVFIFQNHFYRTIYLHRWARARLFDKILQTVLTQKCHPRCLPEDIKSLKWNGSAPPRKKIKNPIYTW